MLSKGPCVEGFIPNLWHYWEVMEPLGGMTQWEKVRSFGGMPLKGKLGFGSLSLSLSLSLPLPFFLSLSLSLSLLVLGYELRTSPSALFCEFFFFEIGSQK
jgi:hypothetical protein